jgi:uncharacterized protein (UPF0303 family)
VTNVDDERLLDSLRAQEERLVFSHFDNNTAWELGIAMRDSALSANHPVVISIRRNGQRLFHSALPGSSADNDAWIDRKSAVVDRYGHSSYFIGCRFRASGGDFDQDSRLDPNDFAAHGGAFPLLLRSTGCIGTVTVSGLPQIEDHRFVVTELERYLERIGELGA